MGWQLASTEGSCLHDYVRRTTHACTEYSILTLGYSVAAGFADMPLDYDYLVLGAIVPMLPCTDGSHQH